MLAIVRLENKIKITIAPRVKKGTHRPKGESEAGQD